MTDGGKIGEVEPYAWIDELVSGPEAWSIREELHRQDERIEQALAERDEARHERDLAIAHDRQPYPTAWAYEQACATLEKTRAENAALINLREAAKAWRRSLGSWDATPVSYNVVHHALIAAVDALPPTDGET
jgi:hypothetical protein